MILGGVFDAHPELQIVVGHMGETLPAMLQRVDVMAPAITGLKKPISAYLRENVHYTFSGFNFLPAFLELILQVGVDRIMFSTDHPYQSMADGRAFLDRLPVSDADQERIAHGNAERLFGIQRRTGVPPQRLSASTIASMALAFASAAQAPDPGIRAFSM